MLFTLLLLGFLGLASSAFFPSQAFQTGFTDDTLANVRDRMLEIANARYVTQCAHVVHRSFSGPSAGNWERQLKH
jgi:hypothetical protein